MSPVVLVVAIGVAGSLGALLRWAADVAISHRLTHAERTSLNLFPWALLLVNVVGSFVCGFATGFWGHSDWGLIIATGLAGGLTTMSTLAVTTLNHLQSKAHRGLAVYSPVLHLVLGVGFAWLGLVLSALFDGV